MSKREKILASIQHAQPPSKPLPVLDYSVLQVNEDLFAKFEQCIVLVGGRVVLIDNIEMVGMEIAAARQSGRLIINRIEGCGNIDELPVKVTEMEKIEQAYIKGSLAVAENGAVWLDEALMGNRILPFICQELVLVVEQQELVANMHNAYQRINIKSTGFGVFIAGPSKTADIEQSLVIGAHGPVALKVLMVKSSQTVNR